MIAAQVASELQRLRDSTRGLSDVDRAEVYAREIRYGALSSASTDQLLGVIFAALDAVKDGVQQNLGRDPRPFVSTQSGRFISTK